MPTATVDYSALTAQVTPADLAAYKAAEKSKPNYRPGAAVVQVIFIVFTLGLALFILLGLLFAGIGIILSAIQTATPIGLILLIVPLVLAAGFGLLAWVIVRAILRGGDNWDRSFRLDRFARANGFVFSRIDPDPQYPGSIFGVGDSRFATDHLRSSSDRYIDYGNYQYTTGSGKNRTTRHWGFLALQMDRSLPNMVLDSKANNGLFGGTNLPAFFTKDQVLHLEGDFDKYFTLYCPKEYEADALYIFTPDLMALLIDEASPFDVEIIDKWMFVYSNTRFDMAQPALHQRLLRIIDTVGAKALSQTDRYTDDRVQSFATNVVAPQGQRLRRGISVGAFIVAGLFVVLWLGPLLTGLLGLLARR